MHALGKYAESVHTSMIDVIDFLKAQCLKPVTRINDYALCDERGNLEAGLDT